MNIVLNCKRVCYGVRNDKHIRWEPHDKFTIATEICFRSDYFSKIEKKNCNRALSGKQSKRIIQIMYLCE